MGFVWVILWLIIYPPRGSRRWISAQKDNNLEGRMAAPAAAADETRGKPNVLRLLRSRQCFTLILARFFTDPVAYFIIFWLPRYLEKARGFDTVMVGKYAWVPFFVGGTDFIFGGWLSGRLMRAGWSLPKARKTAMLVGACLLPSAILAPMAPNAGLAIAAICVLGFGHSVWITNLLTLPADLFDKNEVGTATGLTGTGGSISAVLAALGTGYIVMRFSYQPIFVLAGLLHPMSMALIFWRLPDRDFRKAGGTQVSAA